MKKVIKLTESDLIKIIKRVLSEQSVIGAPNYGTISKPTAPPAPKAIPSLSCIPLAFQSAVSELIKQKYNKVYLKIALGIIGRESDFGESNRYKLTAPLKYLWGLVGGGTSVGYGQVKPETAKQYGLSVDDLTTAIGSLKAIYNILANNYATAVKNGYTTEPSSNFTQGTGNAALDISIAGYNLGVSKITKYCKTNDPNIKKPCNLAGKTITEQIPNYGMQHYAKSKSENQNKKKITVTNQVAPNYLPNFKTKRLDGVSISSHGYVQEVASRYKKYTCF
jgi:hypothetical protein